MGFSDRGTQQPVILARNLSKYFVVNIGGSGLTSVVRSLIRPSREIRRAVDDLSFSVGHGELVALLGPNGAGKSTTIKMLTGILVPSGGELLVNGRIPHADRLRNAAEIGAVFGQRSQLWWDLPAIQSFSILKDIYDIPDKQYRRQLTEFDELLDLSSFWRTPVRQLSLGQRVRCDLAAALLHHPSIVFLDEPTIGMDVVARERVRGLILHLVRRGDHTVILATHDMSDVERLCQRALLIAQGRLLFDGTLAELRRKEESSCILHVKFETEVSKAWVEGGERVHETAIEASFRFRHRGDLKAALQSLITRYPVVEVSVEKSSLEDLVREIYHRNGAGVASPSETLVP